MSRPPGSPSRPRPGRCTETAPAATMHRRSAGRLCRATTSPARTYSVFMRSISCGAEGIRGHPGRTGGTGPEGYGCHPGRSSGNRRDSASRSASTRGISSGAEGTRPWRAASTCSAAVLFGVLGGGRHREPMLSLIVDWFSTSGTGNWPAATQVADGGPQGGHSQNEWIQHIRLDGGHSSHWVVVEPGSPSLNELFLMSDGGRPGGRSGPFLN